MVLFTRIYCHYCGSRSKHGKNSGISMFQCSKCEAVNYLDSRGSITDPPLESTSTHHYTQATRQRSPTPVTLAPAESLQHQTSQPFCNTCIMNQKIFSDTLAGYLPDENHPRYSEFEAALPRYKRELEQRYPQVCRKCAPNVQRKMSRADYFGLTQNISSTTRKGGDRTLSPAARARRRDNWGRWSMRGLLRLCKMVLWTSVTIQVAWHAYGIATTLMNGKPGEWGTTDFDSTMSLSGCAKRMANGSLDSTCFQLLSPYVLRGLQATTLLLWYNPCLPDWVHHSKRIQAIEGQADYYKLQAVILASRVVAYYYLSSPKLTVELQLPQLLAAHGFAIVFILFGSRISKRAVKSVPWQMKGNKATPRPEEYDIFATTAGPGRNDSTPRASSLPPHDLFKKGPQLPFPIHNLAPRSNNITGNPPPSPPISESTIEDGEAMEIDRPSPALLSRGSCARDDSISRRKTYGIGNHTPAKNGMYSYAAQQSVGWSGMRDQIFGMEDGMRAEQALIAREAEATPKLKYEPVEPTPFRGRLPQAPMSMERKLRNPPTQLSFKKTPKSKQQDFLAQMRHGIDDAKNFSTHPKSEKSVHFSDALVEDGDISPAKARTRGQLELRDSGWRLPTDFETATGLEDIFTGSFSLNDEPNIVSARPLPTQMQRPGDRQLTMLKAMLCIAFPFMLATALWQIQDVRRPIALWLVRQLEAAGY